MEHAGFGGLSVMLQTGMMIVASLGSGNIAAALQTTAINIEIGDPGRRDASPSGSRRDIPLLQVDGQAPGLMPCPVQDGAESSSWRNLTDKPIRTQLGLNNGSSVELALEPWTALDTGA
jgi:hypothetical protein